MEGRETHRRRLAVASETAKAKARRRRAEASWFAWAIEEFARYFFGLGVLAILLFAPLQMADAWMPAGREPVISPAAVALLAFAFDTAALYLAIWGYRLLWREDGVVDRAVARYEAQRPR